MTGVWWERERLFNGIILTSLSRIFFTDLRRASADMPKLRFASAISQSANDFFPHFLFLKKLGEGTSMRRSKVTLLFRLTFSHVLISSCSVPTDPTISPLFKH